MSVVGRGWGLAHSSLFKMGNNQVEVASDGCTQYMLQVLTCVIVPHNPAKAQSLRHHFHIVLFNCPTIISVAPI
jgi:hypothetical protein